jgi:hypothetical protein
MRIIELENRCTGNRTVGSNPTLSAIFHIVSNNMASELGIIIVRRGSRFD